MKSTPYVEEEAEAWEVHEAMELMGQELSSDSCF